MIRQFLTDERGTTAIEYAVIASLIFLAIVAAMIPIGEELGVVFQEAADGFQE